ncbi:isoprenylcysteine carboxyl methyltransferase, partial [Burkholderia pseudomallei]
MDHDVRPAFATTRRHATATALAGAARPCGAPQAACFVGILIDVFAGVVAALGLGVFADAAGLRGR